MEIHRQLGPWPRPRYRARARAPRNGTCFAFPVYYGNIIFLRARAIRYFLRFFRARNAGILYAVVATVIGKHAFVRAIMPRFFAEKLGRIRVATGAHDCGERAIIITNIAGALLSTSGYGYRRTGAPRRYVKRDTTKSIRYTNGVSGYKYVLRACSYVSYTEFG